MTKVLLVGNFGAGNIGDELILKSALSQYPDAVVMTSNPKWSQSFLQMEFPCIPMPPTGVRSLLSSFGKKKNQDLESIRYDIEKIVFPGGGLFAIKPQAYFIWYQVLRWCAKTFPGTQIELQHQGIDMPENPVTQGMLKQALKLATVVTVRDKDSKAAVEQCSLLIADVVGDRGEQWIMSKSKTPKRKEELDNKRRVLIHALDGFNFEHIKNQFPGSQYIFVGFEQKDMGSVWKPGMKAVHEKKFDPQKVWSADETLIAVYPQTLEDVYELFQQSTICVGQRLHFLIFGGQYCGHGNTYVLGAPYSTKVDSFAKKNGWGSVKLFVDKK